MTRKLSGDALSADEGDDASQLKKLASQTDWKTNDEPIDRFHMVYVIFFFIGIGTVLPINMFMTASSYFSAKLAGTRYQYMFEGYLLLVYSIGITVSAAISIWLLRSIRITYRLVFSILILISIFTFMAVLAQVDTSTCKLRSGRQAFFILTMAVVFIFSFFGSALFQSSFLGLVSVFPRRYPQSVISGMAFSGVFAAVGGIVSLSVGRSMQSFATIYFSAAALFLSLILVLLYFTRKMEFVQYHLQYLEFGQKNAKRFYQYEEEYDSDDDINSNPQCAKTHQKFSYVWYLLKKIWLLALSLLLCTMVTFAIYPPIMARVRPMQSYPQDPFFRKLFVLFAYLLCALGDFVGAAVALWILLPRPDQDKVLLLLNVLRMVFLPVFLLCNGHPRQYLPVLINNDAPYLILATVLGLSNGYFRTLATIYAPKKVCPRYRESVGAIMFFFNVAGVGAASLVAFLSCSIM
ncbi:Equilibrative nucleoside transporter 3 [Trichoplax sp. H2]|nr:Equilibrative nucleoside transporter 3 [Trichoplax sp. H2]|eukprot:RDD42876.1 Equilibrative nucleoside transporter 3 [Trichoplax sp. H2]